MEKRKYLIASPPYASMCGGIKSLHRLCHLLNERGETAYITGSYMNPSFNTPSINNLSQEELRELQHKAIIVYPDIVPNNPCRFTHAVHWWLGATQPPPPNQLIFAFSEMHQVMWKTPNTLFVWYIEDFFKEPEVENKTKTCCYPGKGSGIDHSPVIELTGNANNSINPSGCIRITPGFPPHRQELVRLFQESKILYTYDNLSVIATEARLCGCPVVIMGHYVIPKEHYGKDEFGKDSIALYGEEEINLEKLKNELPRFKERYELRKQKTENELDLFIEKTQEWNKKEFYHDDPGPYNHKIYGHQNLELWSTR